MVEEYKWESPKLLRNDVAGRVVAGLGLFVALVSISVALGFREVAFVFLMGGFIVGYVLYVTSPNTVVRICDNK
ncbi:MAG: hypothetical protein AB2552_13155 [Candidatus Thiodiazotropha endolucinida]